MKRAGPLDPIARHARLERLPAIRADGAHRFEGAIKATSARPSEQKKKLAARGIEPRT